MRDLPEDLELRTGGRHRRFFSAGKESAGFGGNGAPMRPFFGHELLLSAAKYAHSGHSRFITPSRKRMMGG